MIKLICSNCNTPWYTANTNWDGHCDLCHGRLVEAKDNESQSCILAELISEKEIASSAE